MAQSDYNLGNVAAPAARTKINDVFEAVATQNSGSTEPAATFPFMVWVDTSTTDPVVKIRNAADSGWIVAGTIDTSEGTYLPAGGLSVLDEDDFTSNSATRPPSQQSTRAVFDALAGARILRTGWHPFNKVTVGDSNDGLLWDHAVTGNVNAVETPDFEDGYEYALVFNNVLGPDTETLWDFYKETDAAYQTVSTGPNMNIARFYGTAHIIMPRLVKLAHFVRVLGTTQNESNALVNYDQSISIYDATPQKILRLRVRTPTATNFTGGSIQLLRRREYLTA
jgi:hypothetical protein